MRQWIILLFLSSFFLLFKLGDAPLWERDEPKYAEPAWKMVVSGDWLTPKFNNALRFDKPPLFYWLEGISFLAFGKTEWAARFPSALAGIGIISITYFLGKKISSPATAFISSLILIASPHFLLQCRLSVVDAALTFFLMLALFSIFKLPSSPLFLYLLAFAISMATLIKGPIGIIFPIVTAVLWRLLPPPIVYRLHLRHIIGSIILFLTLTLPWYLAVSFTHGKSYFDSFFLFHNVTRFMQSVDSHKGPIWFYLPIIIGGLFPWSFFLPFISKNLLRQYIEDTNLKLLVIWSVLIIGFFTVAKTKLGSYIFPAYPAIALLAGTFWTALFENKKTPYKTYLPAISFIILILLWSGILIFSPVLLAGLPHQDTTPVNEITLTVSLVLLGLIIAFILWINAATRKYTFHAIFATMAIFFLLGITTLVPVAAKANPGKLLSEQLFLQKLSSNDRIILYKEISNSLVFYSEHPVLFVPDAQAEFINKELQSSAPTFFIIPKKTVSIFSKNISNSKWHLVAEINKLLLYTNK